MTRDQIESMREIAHAAIKRDPFGCAYCRGKHETDAELEACAKTFWARCDAEAAFDGDCADDAEFFREARREAFE